MKIAQHFSAGSQIRKACRAREAGGRIYGIICRPLRGLNKQSGHVFPAINRWAIFNRPLNADSQDVTFLGKAGDTRELNKIRKDSKELNHEKNYCA